LVPSFHLGDNFVGVLCPSERPWIGVGLGQEAIERGRKFDKLHIGMDAETGEIVAAELTTNDVDDASQVGPLLSQVAESVASLTGDGAYDQDGVYRTVADRQP
jgi:hypothetical protein